MFGGAIRVAESLVPAESVNERGLAGNALPVVARIFFCHPVHMREGSLSFAHSTDDKKHTAHNRFVFRLINVGYLRRPRVVGVPRSCLQQPATAVLMRIEFAVIVEPDGVTLRRANRPNRASAKAPLLLSMASNSFLPVWAVHRIFFSHSKVMPLLDDAPRFVSALGILFA